MHSVIGLAMFNGIRFSQSFCYFVMIELTIDQTQKGDEPQLQTKQRAGFLFFFVFCGVGSVIIMIT